MYSFPGNSLDSSSPQHVFVQIAASPFLGAWWPSTKAKYCISKHYICLHAWTSTIKLEAHHEMLPRAGWTQRTCELSHYWRTCLKRIYLSIYLKFKWSQFCSFFFFCFFLLWKGTELSYLWWQLLVTRRHLQCDAQTFLISSVVVSQCQCIQDQVMHSSQFSPRDRWKCERSDNRRL